MKDIKRVDRMWEILAMIDRGDHHRPGSLAKHFKVCDNTIYRDLRVLSRHFPIYFDEEQGCYRFTEGYSFKKISLSPNEVKAVLLGRTVLNRLGKGVAEGIDGLMKKLKVEIGCSADPDLKNLRQDFWFDIDPVEDFKHIEPQFQAIRLALEKGSVLAISYKRMYDQKVTRRKIEPYGLFYSSGIWYVVAWCRDQDAIRIFALDCISETLPTGEHYAVPKDFSLDRYFKGGWHFITYGKPLTVKLWFSPEVARWITRRTWHPTQKIAKKKDGSIIFTATLKGTEEIRRWVYHWGPNCEVLAPKEFRREVAEELRSMVKVYGKK